DFFRRSLRHGPGEPRARIVRPRGVTFRAISSRVPSLWLLEAASRPLSWRRPVRASSEPLRRLLRQPKHALFRLRRFLRRRVSQRWRLPVPACRVASRPAPSDLRQPRFLCAFSYLFLLSFLVLP